DEQRKLSAARQGETVDRSREALGPVGVHLMERVLERDNLKRALNKVRSNKGGSGIDGMRVDELAGYLKLHWPCIREQLLSGAYRPSPVRTVLIPKGKGAVRRLGVPTVLDRFIQQAFVASAAARVGSNVFPFELRLSTTALGASSGSVCARILASGLSLGGGSGLGEVL